MASFIWIGIWMCIFLWCLLPHFSCITGSTQTEVLCHSLQPCGCLFQGLEGQTRTKRTWAQIVARCWSSLGSVGLVRLSQPSLPLRVVVRIKQKTGEPHTALWAPWRQKCRRKMIDGCFHSIADCLGCVRCWKVWKNSLWYKWLLFRMPNLWTSIWSPVILRDEKEEKCTNKNIWNHIMWVGELRKQKRGAGEVSFYVLCQCLCSLTSYSAENFSSRGFHELLDNK